MVGSIEVLKVGSIEVNDKLLVNDFDSRAAGSGQCDRHQASRVLASVRRIRRRDKWNRHSPTS